MLFGAYRQVALRPPRSTVETYVGRHPFFVVVTILHLASKRNTKNVPVPTLYLAGKRDTEHAPQFFVA